MYRQTVKSDKDRKMDRGMIRYFIDPQGNSRVSFRIPIHVTKEKSCKMQKYALFAEETFEFSRMNFNSSLDVQSLSWLLLSNTEYLCFPNLWRDYGHPHTLRTNKLCLTFRRGLLDIRVRTNWFSSPKSCSNLRPTDKMKKRNVVECRGMNRVLTGT